MHSRCCLRLHCIHIIGKAFARVVVLTCYLSCFVGSHNYLGRLYTQCIIYTIRHSVHKTINHHKTHLIRAPTNSPTLII